MSYHWVPDHDSPRTQSPGFQTSFGTSDDGYGPPPPIPPRPAGFGYQPLQAENRTSAAQMHHEKFHSSRIPMGGSQTLDSEYSSSYSQSPILTKSTNSDSTGSQPPPVEKENSTDQAVSSTLLDNLDMITQVLDGISVSAQTHVTSRADQSQFATSNYKSPYLSGDASEVKVKEASMPQPTSSHVEPPQKLPPRDKELGESHEHVPPALRLRPVTECISLPVGFATTWYTHPTAPEYYICSYCYEESIRHTIFENVFQGAYLDDDKMKICLFGRARMKDRLFKDAIAKGSLAEVVNFLSLRTKIPLCAGPDGVKGPNPSGHWYCVKGNQIPSMVVCKACYEDFILAQQFAVNLEPAPEQPPDDMWSCDMALPYIFDEYKRCSETSDWPRFVGSANTRMSLPQCPGTKTIYPEGGGKQWFEPIDGPRGFLICSACYCDCIHYTSEQTKWRDAGPNTVSIYGVSVKCCFGSFNMSVAANRTLRETYDYDLFWTTVETLAREPECDSKGTTDATWYTLKSDPDYYAICRVCYVAIVETLGIGMYFMPKPSILKTAKLICCLNRGIPRFPFYVAKLLELMVTRDPAPLTNFAIEYGAIPYCKQDNDFTNGVWYGWPACTICPECHHHFIRGTALADSMTLRGDQIPESRMCEMYSPRMRKMYLEACASNPLDPTALLTFSLVRRNIYAATMPQWRQMLSNQRLKLMQQQYKNNQSLFYSNLGRTYANSVGSTHTFGAADVGYGFHNEWELDGARLGREAAALGNEIQNSSWTIPADELETRWRQVE